MAGPPGLRRMRKEKRLVRKPAGPKLMISPEHQLSIRITPSASHHVPDDMRPLANDCLTDRQRVFAGAAGRALAVR
jgi:hypothetical protein